MANFDFRNFDEAGAGAVDMLVWDAEGLGDYDVVRSTSTRLSLSDGDEYVRFSGTGLRYRFDGDALEAVTAGTITRLAIGEEGASGGATDPLLDVTGLSVSAVALARAAFAANDSRYADVLTSGDDRIRGTGQGDVLLGGAGQDVVTGGGGADTFVFRRVADSRPGQADTVTDFRRARGDVLDLRRIDADEGRGGDQDFDLIGARAFSGTAGELRVRVVDGGLLVRGDTDGDGVADLAIRLTGLRALDEGDFLL